MNKHILVIAPHPDDEVMGCGGTIAKHIDQGDDVFVLVVTRGIPEIYTDEHIRRINSEMNSAHAILGVRRTQVLDFPAPKLDVVPGYEIAEAISTVIQEWRPDTVYVPHKGDIHTDHLKVHIAALVASRPVKGFNVRRLLSYETLSETDWATPTSDNAFIPTVFVDISEYLEIKVEAMRCYASQVKPLPSTRSLESIRALARLRGGTVSVDAAEAFSLVRHIE